MQKAVPFFLIKVITINIRPTKLRILIVASVFGCGLCYASVCGNKNCTCIFSQLIIAIKSSIYSGSYCSHEMEWRSSTECESMGSLIFIASVASVSIAIHILRVQDKGMLAIHMKLILCYII